MRNQKAQTRIQSISSTHTNTFANSHRPVPNLNKSFECAQYRKTMNINDTIYTKMEIASKTFSKTHQNLRQNRKIVV